MEKIIIIAISLLFTGSVAFAQNSNSINSQSGNNLNEIQIQNQTQNQGDEQQIINEEWIREQEEKGINIIENVTNRAMNVNELREMIQIHKEEMTEELENLSDDAANVYKNQNQVREAVHTLLAAEDIIGGVGPQVSEIAKEFNNSIVATVQAEERIQNRSSFMRFFFGGDEEAAAKLKQQIDQNRQRLEQLNQLKEDCSCSDEVKQIIQEQVQTMEQEQDRLNQIAQDEQSMSGIFGWFKNLFRFNK